MSDEEILSEAAYLILCLRDLPCAIPATLNWENLLESATQNGVLPLFNRALERQDVATPAFFTTAMQQCVADVDGFAALLEELLTKFSEQHIDVIPLKGPPLAERLYENASMRMCNDLDLLVRTKDYSRTEALLLSLGFNASSEIDDYHRRFARNGLPVELHFSIASPRYFPFDLSGVWYRASSGKFRSSPMRVISDEDLILFLCLHGIKHGFSRIIWILDVARALNTAHSYNYEELATNAQRRGQAPWLLVGCEVVREMFPQYLPPELDAVIAKSPRQAERARQIAAQLFAEGLEVINDHKLRSFYLQMERSACRRWRCRLSFLLPTGEDDRWAKHHRISRKLMVFLRPFRLMHKYGLRRVWHALFPPAP